MKLAFHSDALQLAERILSGIVISGNLATNLKQQNTRDGVDSIVCGGCVSKKAEKRSCGEEWILMLAETEIIEQSSS